METKVGLGWRPDKPDIRDRKYSFARALAGEMQSAGMLPPSAQPQRREVDAHGVLDQGRTGSCTGHGTGLCAAVERNVKARSPFFIYYEARRLIGETDVDNGAYIRDAVKVCSNLGAPVLSKWPSDPDKLYTDPGDKADADAAKRRIFTYHRLDDDNGQADRGTVFRSCLAGGHLFTIGFTCYSNFVAPGSLVERFGIATMPQGGEEGGHCIAVIGYNDEFPNSEWAQQARNAGFPASLIPQRVYECQNSWGASWGRRGRFVMPAEFLEDDYLADDAWTLRGFSETR